MILGTKSVVETYKAFRVSPTGQPRYLFHGIDGTTTVPLDTWLKADNKMVRDGTGPTTYMSGFHSLPTPEEVVRWQSLLKDPSRYVVVKVLVKETWHKEHSRGNVILSNWLYVPTSSWHEARREEISRYRSKHVPFITTKIYT